MPFEHEWAEAYAKEIVKYSNPNTSTTNLSKMHLELLETNKKFREALEFYANKENYGKHKPLSCCGIDEYDLGHVEYDGGKKASNALKKEK